MIRVMICDDIEEICTFFKKAISQTSDMEVVAVANSGIDAVEFHQMLLSNELRHRCIYCRCVYACTKRSYDRNDNQCNVDRFIP